LRSLTELQTRYYELETARGISFEKARKILEETENPDKRDGFYEPTFAGESLVDVGFSISF